MKISIFSKFQMDGGSERRAVELANGLVKLGHQAEILCCSIRFPSKLRGILNESVGVINSCLEKPYAFYATDAILVINTDSKEFCTRDFWEGKSVSNFKSSINLDLLSDTPFLFLFNFIVSPARHIFDLRKSLKKVGILTTNTKFYDEITKQDRYENIRDIPRFILQSPIDEGKITYNNNIFSGDKVRFCSISKSLDNKWNNDILKLVIDLRRRYNDNISFTFMGMKRSLVTKFKERKFPNCECLDEGQKEVNEVLSNSDVFLFMPDWRREEPWARVIGEALVAGLPVIGLDKGGVPDQILDGNNGFLCKKYDDYLSACVKLIEHKEIGKSMGKNSRIYSRDFTSEKICKRLVDIIELINE